MPLEQRGSKVSCESLVVGRISLTDIAEMMYIELGRDIILNIRKEVKECMRQKNYAEN